MLGNVTGAASLNVLKSGDTMTGTLTLPAGTVAAPSFTGSAGDGKRARISFGIRLGRIREQTEIEELARFESPVRRLLKPKRGGPCTTCPLATWAE